MTKHNAKANANANANAARQEPELEQAMSKIGLWDEGSHEDAIDEPH